MQQKINKKIIFYFIIFFLLGSLFNKELIKLKFPMIEEINVTGIDSYESENLIKNLSHLKFKNIFFLDNSDISKILDTYNLVDSYSIFKLYPSSINIKINKTKFLAKVNKNGNNFFLGSNGKFIKANEEKIEVPYIFGDFNFKEFVILKKIIDNSNFNYKEIKKFYFFPSGRWDLETQSGLLIKLSKNNIKENFDLFLKIFDNEKFNKIKMIDFRQSNQVIIDE